MQFPLRPMILGSGSFVPEQRITNSEFFSVFRPAGLKDNVPEGVIRRSFGIVSRAFDFDTARCCKPSRGEGGIYDGDLAVAAATRALENADVGIDSIGTVIHCSPTPSELHFQAHFGEIMHRLGVSGDANMVHIDLGCSALLQAFRAAAAYLAADPDRHILLIATQCSSATVQTKELLDRYLTHSNVWAWLGASIFSDGAGALVLGSNRGSSRGIIHTYQHTNRDFYVVRHQLGGSDAPIVPGNVDSVIYSMNAFGVGTHFTDVMATLFERLKRDWQERIQPVVGKPFSIEAVARWYFHQANGRLIRQSSRRLGIPDERAPMNVQTLGNTSGPSTLLLFDDDTRNGRLHEGEVVVFFLIGGGNGGAHYGYSVAVV